MEKKRTYFMHADVLISSHAWFSHTLFYFREDEQHFRVDEDFQGKTSGGFIYTPCASDLALSVLAFVSTSRSSQHFE